MVKYGEQMLQGRVNEWQPYYINYTRLKGWIKQMEKDKSDSARMHFDEELRANLKRVDCFYTAQEARLLRQVMQLPTDSLDQDDAERKTEGADIKMEISKLIDFAEGNMEGLRKITKKFDKKVDVHVNAEADLEDASVQQQMLSVLQTYPFTHARERLSSLETTIDDWTERQDWNEPTMCGRSFTRQETFLAVPSLKTDHIAHDYVAIFMSKKMPKIIRKTKAFLIDNVIAWLFTAAFGAAAVYGVVQKFDNSGYLVCWVTTLVLVLLVRQNPPDGVLPGATLFLTIAGVLTPQDAWAAFANDVVLSVAGLGCIAQAVGGTGVIDMVFSAILGKPKTVHMAMLRLFIPSIFLNVCISNTCVMSCLLPVLDKWSVEIGVHKAMFLMPLSYILLISGVFAVFSTSTNLIAQGLLVTHHQPEMDTFALSVPVVICTVAAIVYLLIATPIVLKRFLVNKEESDTTDTTKCRLTTTTYDIRMQLVGKALPGKTLASSGILDRLQMGIGAVVSCERYGDLYGEVTEDFELQLDDIFLLKTSAEGIVHIRDLTGILILPLDSSEALRSISSAGWQTRELVEVVIDQSCRMVKHRMVNSREYFPRSHDCKIVAYRSFREQTGKLVWKDVPTADWRQGSQKSLVVVDTPKKETSSKMVPLLKDASDSPYRQEFQVKGQKGLMELDSDGAFERQVSTGQAVITAVVLQEGERAADLPEKRLAKGDHIIFDAPSDFYQRYKESSDFVVVRRITKVQQGAAAVDISKAYIAGAILFMMIMLVASNTLPLLEAVMLALAGLIVTQCTSLDTVVKAVKLNTVLTIVGAFGLGKAIGQQHVAEAMADLLLWVLAPFGKSGLLAAVFASTVALGVVFHGTAVVVLMYPICQEAALRTNIPIHQVVAVLCIAVSCQMLSPISYQTNLMAYSAGGYQFTDFTKLGSGLVLVLACVSIPLCEYWFA